MQRQCLDRLIDVGTLSVIPLCNISLNVLYYCISSGGMKSSLVCSIRVLSIVMNVPSG